MTVILHYFKKNQRSDLNEAVTNEGPSPGSLQDSPLIALLHLATRLETDSIHISTQLDWVFIISTQQGSDSGRKQQRERWHSGGSHGGGVEVGTRIKESRGGRVQTREKKWRWVLCGAEGEDSQGVCERFFLDTFIERKEELHRCLKEDKLPKWVTMRR